MANIYQTWRYKYEILISNPSSTDGFQAKLTLSWKPGMRADFRDVRFSDKYGNEIKFWRESYTQFSSAIIWLALPANETEIFVYYGNGRVDDGSSGEEVFDFFDDFSTCCLSSSKWTLDHGSYTASNGIITLYSTSKNCIIYSKTTYAVNTIIEYRCNHENLNKTIMGYFDGSSNGAAWLGANGTDNHDWMWQRKSGSTSDYINLARGGTTYYIYGVSRVSTSDVKYYVNYSYIHNLNGNIPTGSLPVYFYSTIGKRLNIDWVRIRKYSVTEPTFTLGKKYVLSNYGFLQQIDHITDSITTYAYTDSSGNDKLVDSVTTHVSTNFAVGVPDPISDAITTYVTCSEPALVDRDELRDYTLVSCDISKTITDAYWQLTATFSDDKVPSEGSTVKYYARDSSGNSHLLFLGKVIALSPTLGSYYTTMQMQAADNSRNLIVQKVPWNWQVISLVEPRDTWPIWIGSLADYQKSGVAMDCIIDEGIPDKQFIFDPKKTRWDAIKEVANYCGLVINIKLIEYELAGVTSTVPGISAVPAADIDEPYGGFMLPTPITFDSPGNYNIEDQPSITGEQEEKYNMVTVYGVLSSTNTLTVASVYTPAVYTGEEKAREYIAEVNNLSELGITAEIEAIRRLLYFATPRATVTMKFIERFDFELYQRIKFGSGFPTRLQELTNSTQLPYVIAYDPRDEENSKHIIDVSGVPRPSWLRISGLKYHSEKNTETVEVTSITDFIYSRSDPVVSETYSIYCPAGYLKPVADDNSTTTQDMIDTSIETQLGSENGTILFYDEDTQTVVFETSSGKQITAKVVT